MHKWAAWKRRGFAIAALALAFALVAPELAVPAGAASSRVELAGRRKRALSPAARKAKILAAMKAQALAKAKTQAAQPTTTLYKGAKKPKLTAAGLAKLRRALAAKSQTAKRAALNRRAAAAALAARRAAKKTKKTKKKKSSSLSLPMLAFLAILPFVLIGIYLLASDYWRRRVPRKRNASLVITRVRDR
jgi:ABC-type Na+ efflux pump permease subunit